MPVDAAHRSLHLCTPNPLDLDLSSKLIMNSMLYSTSQRASMHPSLVGLQTGFYQDPSATSSEWSTSSSTWSASGLDTWNRALHDLPCASKSRYSHARRSSLGGFNTFGDDVFDPSELRGRYPWPIGASPNPRSTSLDPFVVQNHKCPPPKPLSVSRTNGETRGGADPRLLPPPRCSSAPPGLRRQPLSVLQEVDEWNEAGVQIMRPDAPQPPVVRGHSPRHCAHDPLCATHRKRPAREPHPVSRPAHLADPHKRRPLALKERRPQHGCVPWSGRAVASFLTRESGSRNGVCDDLECVSRSCADCAYLRSRGGLLHTKIARRAVEAKLELLDYTSQYSEDTLGLLRFRAVRQVRRSMA
ncbi:hypothetical protein BN946_scf184804.g12 [Trametes cinnabarina]|uniref:Uncharacterized protein n=1 Tax=Pycnoporus cinnabarinus TaxID=5643 RepID=A0A060S960_PYCCI|nr:hypothetical protein BN946_scf184804.g12 [Trametes cinnabarina]